MTAVPKWIRVLRTAVLAGLPIMLFNCWNAWEHELPQWDELVASTLILFGCTHLLLRAPYRPWRVWEWPPAVFSVALVASGGFLFTPADEDRKLGLQVFIGAFAGLAVSYGFFCSGVPKDHQLRESVIAPTKKFSEIGVVGFDFGLVGAPFAFLFFLARHYLRGARKRSPQ